MRTTLDLPDETFRKLKAEAALRGFKLKEFVAQLIERGLAEGALPPPAGRSRRSFAIPIAREADGSVTPALSNAQLHAILEKEDIAEYRRVARPTSSNK